jgi:SAP domain
LLSNKSNSGFISRQVATYISQIKSFTIPELKNICISYNINQNGKKAQLLTRLAIWVRDEISKGLKEEEYKNEDDDDEGSNDNTCKMASSVSLNHDRCERTTTIHTTKSIEADNNASKIECTILQRIAAVDNIELVSNDLNSIDGDGNSSNDNSDDDDDELEIFHEGAYGITDTNTAVASTSTTTLMMDCILLLVMLLALRTNFMIGYRSCLGLKSFVLDKNGQSVVHCWVNDPF